VAHSGLGLRRGAASLSGSPRRARNTFRCGWLASAQRHAPLVLLTGLALAAPLAVGTENALRQRTTRRKRRDAVPLPLGVVESWEGVAGNAPGRAAVGRRTDTANPATPVDQTVVRNRTGAGDFLPTVIGPGPTSGRTHDCAILRDARWWRWRYRGRRRGPLLVLLALALLGPRRRRTERTKAAHQQHAHRAAAGKSLSHGSRQSVKLTRVHLWSSAVACERRWRLSTRTAHSPIVEGKAAGSESTGSRDERRDPLGYAAHARPPITVGLPS
jgi:hypothetical protein